MSVIRWDKALKNVKFLINLRINKKKAIRKMRLRYKLLNIFLVSLFLFFFLFSKDSKYLLDLD